MPLMRIRLASALILSFAIYGFPLLLPHVNIFLAQVLWDDLSGSQHDGLWIATDFGFALILQFSAFHALNWLFAKPSSRRAAIFVAAGPPAALAIELAYSVAIPSFSLIENDTAPISGDWPVECTARGVALLEIAHPSSVASWPEVLVQGADASYHVMRIPGCAVTPLLLPRPTVQDGRADFTIRLNYFVPGHGVVFSRSDGASGAVTWNVLSDGGVTAIPDVPSSAIPILSMDGESVAWIEGERVMIERIDRRERPLSIDLPPTPSNTLRAVDVQRGLIELTSLDRPFILDFTGHVRSEPGVWLNWEVYRD